jgi:indole-3-glycerol phosphate synthase
MNNILEEIFQHKLIEVRNKKKQLPLSEICKKIKCLDKDKNRQAKSFFSALKNKHQNNQIGLIAEVKKASPSAGIIKENFNHLEIAKIYQENQATCLSVLTDEKYFQGSDLFLKEISEISSLPILRKDFIVDCYQIYQAKMLGASCILLIVAMIDDKKLIELENCAIQIGLDVLIEIHDEIELQRAMKMKSKMIGINNRNLKTMKVDIENSIRLSSLIPNDYLIISESGIKNKNDISMLREKGINCFLIGENLIKQNNIAQAMKEIFS